MTSAENRLRRLEQQASNSTPRDRYLAALKRTNGTGMASLADYALTQRGSAREVGADWCARAPFHHAVVAAGVEVSGLATVAAVPPDVQLPEESCADLDYVSGVVHEVPEAPVSPALRTHRIECATWYLALGDDRGLAIRGAVWEKVPDGWRCTNHVEELAKSAGMTKDGLDWLSQHHPHLFPRWEDPIIRERVRSSRGATAWIPGGTWRTSSRPEPPNRP